MMIPTGSLVLSSQTLSVVVKYGNRAKKSVQDFGQPCAICVQVTQQAHTSNYNTRNENTAGKGEVASGLAVAPCNDGISTTAVFVL